MDNIEKLKKINELTKELKKHGIASSNEDAASQAKSIIQGTSKTSNLESANEIKPESNDYYLKQQIMKNCENLIQTNNEFLLEQINKLQTKISELQQEISKLKQRPPAKEEKTKQTKIANEPHAKVGAFRTGDVAVDKIFYFGQK